MAETKSIKVNMVMNSLLTMSSFIFPLITFPYVSRILLPDGTGRVNFASSVIAYFAMFAQLGIPTYGVKKCAQVRDDKEKFSKTVHELLIINIVMCLIAYIVFFACLFFVPKFYYEKELFIIMGLSVGMSTIGVEWAYKALEQYGYITARTLIFKVIAYIGMFLLIKNHEDYVIYGALTIFAGSASNICNFVHLRKYVILKPLGNYNFIQHIKPILAFFSMTIATTIYTNLDSVMLGFMTNETQVGYYGAAIKMKTILVSVVTSVSAVLLPRASYYIDKNLIEQFYQILKKTMHFIIIISVPLAVFSIIFSKQIIFFLASEAYSGAISPMRIIMPTLVLIAITNIIGIQMLIPLGKETQVLYSEIFGAIVDVVLNIIFIPIYGCTGAAIGTLVAEICVLIWQVFAIRNDLHILFSEVPIVKVVVCTVIASVASLIVPLAYGVIFIQLLMYSILFFGLYLLGMLVVKDRLIVEMLKQTVNKISRK